MNRGAGPVHVLPALLLCAGLGLAAAPDADGEVGLLIEARLPGVAVARRVVPEGVRLYRFDAASQGDPIAEGRLLAALQDTEQLVVVGPEAAGWAARRLDNSLIHFVGGAASVPRARRGWSGSVGFRAAQVLGFARAAGWRHIGVACTPDFAPLLPDLREAARNAGVRLSERTVAAPHDVPEAVQALMGSADAFFLLGGPLMTTGAAFTHIIEASLAARVPVIAPEARLVARGAYVAFEPDWEGVIGEAVALSTDTALRKPVWPTDKVAFAQSDGRLLVNEALKRRWNPAARGGGR